MDDHQARPSLADPKLLDRLLDLDRGMGVADPVDKPPTRPVLTAPVRVEPAAEPGSIERPVTPPGRLAARRRPWRTPMAAGSSALDLLPPAPPVGGRARGPSIGNAPAPTPPPSRLKRSLAPVPLDASGLPAANLTYELFYGFDEKPFSLSSDPKFVYHSASFDGATQDLADAIGRREGIMLVTGEKGTGKTTFCLSLVSQIGGSMRISLLTDPPASVGELFKSVQESAVVIIDEAQRLSVEVLQQLYRLSEGGRGAERLQIVLVGEPELLTLLRRRGLRELHQRVRTRCRLEPLTADEVTGYVAHRLAVAGTGVRVEFDEGATARLHAISCGVPRVINQVCDAALAEAQRIAASNIDRALIAAAADALGLAAPRSVARSLVRAAARLVAFVTLLLVGAAAAAWVFGNDLERAVIEWEARPPVPEAPPHQLPTLGLPLPPDQGSPGSEGVQPQ